MKRLVVGVWIVCLLILSGGKGFCDEPTHWISGKPVDFQITLFADDGYIIKEWVVTNTTSRGLIREIEIRKDCCRFVTDEGKLVYISGTYLIEEL